MNKNMSYPFERLKDNETITRKEAKAFIVKFLKREGCFKEMVSECMLSHHFNTVEEVLNNMVKTSYLDDCLFYADRIFSWESAKIYHVANRDGYWSKLRDGWWKAIGYPYIRTFLKNDK